MKLFYKNHKLYLTFPYNEALIEQVKELPAAKWDKEYKAWSFPSTSGCYENIKKKFNVKIDEFEVKKKIKVKGYKFKVKPYAHQKEGIEFILEKFGFEI